MFKKFLWLFIFLLFVGAASAQYYYDQGSGGFDFSFQLDAFFEWYDANPYFFDFFIFLALFGLVMKMIFKEKAKLSVSMGLGVVLAFSLVLWERQSDFTLMTFGPIALFLLALCMFFLVIHYLGKVKSKFLIMIIAIGILIFFFYAYSNLHYFLPERFWTYVTIAVLILLLILFIILWVKLSKGKRESVTIAFKDKETGGYYPGWGHQ